MAGEGVRVEGLRETLRDLQTLGLEIDDLKDAFSEVADFGAREVAARTPRASGRLAGTVRGNRAKGKAVVTIGRATVAYAGPINYGWPARNIAPSGFLQDADAAITPTAIDRLEAAIDTQIKKRGLT